MTVLTTEVPTPVTVSTTLEPSTLALPSFR